MIQSPSGFVFYVCVALFVWLAVVALVHLCHWINPSRVDDALFFLGLRVSLTSLTFTTTSLIRPLGAWSNRKRRFLSPFYTAGCALCLLVACLGPPLLAFNLVQMLMTPEAPVALSPIIPGLTVPWSDSLLWFFALAVCAVVHEAGHAVASMLSGCPVQRFGFMLIVGFSFGVC